MPPVAVQFCDGSFRGDSEPPDPFYERGCRNSVEVDGRRYVVDVLELPSKHIGSHTMLEQALTITEGAALIYDVSDPSSLTQARAVIAFVRDHVDGSRPYGLLLVGNKNDISDDERSVKPADGSDVAAASAARCAFVEVSAKTGHGIPDLFPRSPGRSWWPSG